MSDPNERHRTMAETRYWCDQYRLRSEKLAAEVEALRKGYDTDKIMALADAYAYGHTTLFKEHNTIIHDKGALERRAALQAALAARPGLD